MHWYYFSLALSHQHEFLPDSLIVILFRSSGLLHTIPPTSRIIQEPGHLDQNAPLLPILY